MSVKVKKPSRKALVKKADDAFSRYIRARDKFCVQCGTNQNLTCGHLFSRVAYSTRWNENAAAAQCRGHNLTHEYDAYPFTQYFIDKYGKACIDRLHSLWSQPIKYKNYQLEEIARYYDRKAAALLNGGAQ